MASPYAGLLHREPLSADECRERFRGARWARLLHTVRCLPAARLAPLALVEDSVIIATDEPTIWEAAGRQEVLTVSVDGVESSGATWTVTATGPAQLVNPCSGDNSVKFDSTMLEFHRRGAHLVMVPLILIAGDLTIWSFPHSLG